jgi:hypothetical protein
MDGAMAIVTMLAIRAKSAQALRAQIGCSFEGPHVRFGMGRGNVSDYRCYFMKANHIVSVEILTGCRDDSEASGMALMILAERKREEDFDRAEVWDQGRKISHHDISAVS